MENPARPTEKLNPWGSIWIAPRRTIRYLIDTNSGYAVLSLALITGAMNLCMQVTGFLRNPPIVTLLLGILLASIGGALLGLLGLYSFGWLYRWVGSWMGGQATTRELRAAIAWTHLPTVAIFLVWIIGTVAVYSQGQGDADAAESSQLVFGFAFVGAQFVFGVWAFVLLSRAIGEVHRFSSWKGFGTVLIPLCLLTIPVAFIVLVVAGAVAIPNFVRARATPYESAGRTGMRALKSSLDVYRSMKDHYPATADWAMEMYPVGEEPLAPPAFQTNNRLSDYVMEGYRFSYESEGGTTYSLRAVPQEWGVAGTRAGASSFYTDANPNGAIYHCIVSAEIQEATADDRTLDEPPVLCGKAKEDQNVSDPAGVGTIDETSSD